MKFTMQVNKIIATTMGHTIEFKKGEPTHVPKECWAEVQAAGAVPADAEALEPKVKKNAAPNDPNDRKAAIFAAIDLIVEGNKREDFGADSTPNVKAIEKLTGFDTDGKEVKKLWAEYRQEKGNK